MSDPIAPGVRGIVFDVNETLSDLAPLAELFESVGASRELFPTWFAGILRDAFALAAVGASAAFSDLAREQLRVLLPVGELSVPLDAAVSTILDGFAQLDVHDDVPPSLRALADTEVRILTLSNGAARVAEGLLERAGLADTVEAFLSVEGASRWKPAPESYEIAVRHSGIPAPQLLLVAVHPWDIHGAAAAGLRTAWLNRDGGRYPDYFTAPDHVLPDLRGLVDLVDGRG